MTDTEILELSYKNPSKFGLLFDKHHKRFLAIAKKSLSNKEDAEDVVQEVFVRIYKYGRKFTETGGNFEYWSGKILHNCIATKISKRVESRGIVSPLSDEMISTIEEDLDPQREARAYFSSVLSKIDKTAKEVLELRYLAHKSFKEIGKTLGITSSAARVRAHRAKKEFLEIHKQLL